MKGPLVHESMMEASMNHMDLQVPANNAVSQGFSLLYHHEVKGKGFF